MSTETGFANRIKDTLKSIIPWVLVTCIGGALVHVGLVFIAFLFGRFGGMPDPSIPIELPRFQFFFEEFLIGMIPGLVIGFLQWTIIRNNIQNAWLWIVVTGLSFGISISMGFVIPDININLPWWIILEPWLFMGLFVGFGQWLFLRSKLDHVGWWVPGTTLGFVIGGSGWNIFGLVGAEIGWAIAGIITGLILHFQFRSINNLDES